VVPGERLIRTAIGLPWTVARRVIGLGAGLVPGSGGEPQAPARPEPDPDVQEAAAEALERDRDPREEAIFTPDDDFFDDDHVESEVELVAESADADATEPPGAQLHVDEPWEGYRRQKVAEITAQLEGQPAEVLAAVELYEMTHRKRQGVLEAVRSATRG
jgi:hypothetical protein